MFLPLSETFTKLLPALSINCMMSKFNQDEDNNNKFRGNILTASILNIGDIIVNNDKIYKQEINLKVSNYLQDISKAYNSFSKESILNAPKSIKAKPYFIYKPFYLNNKNIVLYAPIYIDKIDDIPHTFYIHITLHNSEDHKLYYIEKYLYIDLSLLKKYLIRYINNVGFNNNMIYISKYNNYYDFEVNGIDLLNGSFIQKSNKLPITEKKYTDTSYLNETVASLFVDNNIAVKTIIPISFALNINDILNEDEKYMYRNSHYSIKYYYVNNDYSTHSQKYTIKQFYDKYIVAGGKYENKTILPSTIYLDKNESKEHTIFFKNKYSTDYVLNLNKQFNCINYSNIFNGIAYKYQKMDYITEDTDFNRKADLLVRLYNYFGHLFPVKNQKTMVYNNIFNINNLLYQYRSYITMKYKNMIPIIESEDTNVVTYKELLTLLENLQHSINCIEYFNNINIPFRTDKYDYDYYLSSMESYFNIHFSEAIGNKFIKTKININVDTDIIDINKILFDLYTELNEIGLREHNKFAKIQNLSEEDKIYHKNIISEIKSFIDYLKKRFSNLYLLGKRLELENITNNELGTISVFENDNIYYQNPVLISEDKIKNIKQFNIRFIYNKIDTNND